MTDPNYQAMVTRNTALAPNAPVHIVAGPHRGKKGRIHSASGDGHVLVQTNGEATPVRVNTDHVIPADADSMLRHMAANLRKPGAASC